MSLHTVYHSAPEKTNPNKYALLHEQICRTAHFSFAAIRIYSCLLSAQNIFCIKKYSLTGLNTVVKQ